MYQMPIVPISTISARPACHPHAFVVLHSLALESLAGIDLDPTMFLVDRPSPSIHVSTQVCHDAALGAHRQPQATCSACLAGALRPLGPVEEMRVSEGFLRADA